jgi:hypothetical protein
MSSSEGGATAGDARGRSLELLAAFDEAWVTYLEQFAAWKLADAATLEVLHAFSTVGDIVACCRTPATYLFSREYSSSLQFPSCPVAHLLQLQDLHRSSAGLVVVG